MVAQLGEHGDPTLAAGDQRAAPRLAHADRRADELLARAALAGLARDDRDAGRAGGVEAIVGVAHGLAVADVRLLDDARPRIGHAEHGLLADQRGERRAVGRPVEVPGLAVHQLDRGLGGLREVEEQQVLHAAQRELAPVGRRGDLLDAFGERDRGRVAAREIEPPQRAPIVDPVGGGPDDLEVGDRRRGAVTVRGAPVAVSTRSSVRPCHTTIRRSSSANRA